MRAALLCVLVLFCTTVAQALDAADELAKDGRTPDQSTLEEMDRLWDAAKAAEKAGPSS